MILDTLHKISTNYSSLSIESMQDWSKYTLLKKLPKKHQLVKEGECSNKLWYVISGSVQAYYIKDGKRISDWFVFEDEFINSISSYFLGEQSAHFIELQEDSILLETNRDDMLELYNRHHDMERLSRIILTRTMIKLQKRIVSLQFHAAKEKYEYLINEYPQIELRISLGDIASFLGITQETLSRIRSS